MINQAEGEMDIINYFLKVYLPAKFNFMHKNIASNLFMEILDGLEKSEFIKTIEDGFYFKNQKAGLIASIVNSAAKSNFLIKDINIRKDGRADGAKNERL